MTTLLEIRLRGPVGLQDGGACIFDRAEAWQPGLYLWTFLYNQSDRINRVGVANDGIARAHADHLAAFLRGDYPFHVATDRATGTLRRVYQPGDGIEAYIAARADLRAELQALRIFYAPVDACPAIRQRIADAIASHINKLGGKALAWFDAGSSTGEAPAVAAPPFTARFFRPVHMASMPDELTV